jgi:hypothetical protein
MRLYREESGQALILTATSLLVLMGFLALATDVGILFHDRREMQTAADGAAAAAALEMFDGGSSSNIILAAHNAATKNGFTDGSNGVTVTVHNPPTSGYHQSGGNVEVDITQASIPTVLMGLFGAKTVSVSARAVGSDSVSGKACIWLGNSSGTDLKIQGSAKIEAPGCGIYLNSTDPSALDTIGNGNTVDAAYIGLVGGSIGSGTPQGTTVSADVAPQTNPFGTTVSSGEPVEASACSASNTTSGTTFSGSLTVNNGATVTYTDHTGKSVTVPTSTNVWCFSGTNVDITGATLNNGIFVFEHGVTIGTTGTTTISNGTLDVDQGVYNQASNSVLDIVAPTVVGKWNNGIALLVPPTNTTYTATTCSKNPNDAQELMVQFGSNNQTLSGYIYAPAATVTLHDQGGGVTASGLIAGSLCDLSGTINITDYNTVNPTTAPILMAALVE